MILQKVPENTEVSISSAITTRTVHSDGQSTNLSSLGEVVLVTQEPSQLQRSWVEMWGELQKVSLRCTNVRLVVEQPSRRRRHLVGGEQASFTTS